MTELDIKIAELREEIAKIENDPNNDGEDLNSLVTELGILEAERERIKLL
jgi:hypothetical protein